MLYGTLLGIITLLLVSLFLAAMHFFFWRRRIHEQFTLYWSIAWGFYVLRYVCDALVLLYPLVVVPAKILIDAFSGFSGLFLLWGVREIDPQSRDLPAAIVLAPVLTTLWSATSNIFWHNPVFGAIPTFILLGLVQIYTGLVLLRSRTLASYRPAKGLGWIMILSGLHKLNYPVAREITWAAAYGYWVAGLLTMTVAVLMLLLTLDRLGQERDSSNQRYKTLFDNTRDLILVVGLDGQILDVNRVAVETYGYSYAELTGLTIFDLHARESKDKIRAKMQQANSSGTLFEAEHRLANGEQIPVEVSSIGSTVDGQRVLVSIIRNVSERQKSQQLYEATFENTGTAMLIIEEDMTITLVNRQFENLTGYTRLEVEGQASFADFIAPSHRQLMINYHRRRRESEPVVPRQYEFGLIDRTGHRKEVLCTVEMIPGTARTVASWLNITERKRAEEQVKYLSFHDKVTGLYNRAYFEEVLERLDTPSQLPISIIMGDLNGLKLINDAFGHKAGDELLARIAQLLKSIASPDDVIARWGGDEFIILLPRTGTSKAEEVVQRISNACRELRMDNPVRPSISLGVATKGQPEQPIHELVHLAEDQMYRNKLMETRSFRNSLVASLVESLRERDFETEEHAERLKEYVIRIGRELGLHEAQLNELTLLAALHDIGKLGIPDSILMKPGPLTDEEWEIMKRHPEIGYRIASASPDLAIIAEAILAHHERFDGQGYPRGLTGSDIPLYARIISVVDAYDVMTHERPYKQALTSKDALAELQRCRNSQFDPEIVDVFIKVISADLTDLDEL